MLGQNQVGHRPKASFGPVPPHRITDLAANRKADPETGCILFTRDMRPGLQNQAGRDPFTATAGDLQEFAPPL